MTARLSAGYMPMGEFGLVKESRQKHWYSRKVNLSPSVRGTDYARGKSPSKISGWFRGTKRMLERESNVTTRNNTTAKAAQESIQTGIEDYKSRPVLSLDDIEGPEITENLEILTSGDVSDYLADLKL
jgi:hypothetical protein